MQEQRSIFPVQLRQGDGVQKLLSRRWLAAALLAVAVTLLLILFELGSLLLLNPAHALVLPFSPLIGFLMCLLEFGLIFIGALLMMKPLAITTYLRTVHRAQEPYNRLYTPLPIVTTLHQPDSLAHEHGNAQNSTQDEHVSVLDLLERQQAHQFIVGMPGAGKTMALHMYHYRVSQKPFASLSKTGKIPIYIPMQDYSLFLAQHPSLLRQTDDTRQDAPPSILLAYLMQSDLSDRRYLRSYVARLFQRGQLLLLCDGLNEIASDYLPVVGEDLVRMMRRTRNRFVLTGREVDYLRQPGLMQVVADGQAAYASIQPLPLDQVAELVERHVERQDKQWKHTAGQVMSVIERSRLRYHCTNPLLLQVLLAVIDKIGVERGRQSDTRGRLLREYVRQLLASERRQTKWGQHAPTEQEVIRYLGEIACADRWSNASNALQLLPSSLLFTSGGKDGVSVNTAELAKALRSWLEQHPARAAFMAESASGDGSPKNAAQLLQLAIDAELIEVTSDNVLRFSHESIAHYFVAEYFATTTPKSSPLPVLREELVEDVERWSEVVALWAGLLDEPLELAESFDVLGRQEPAYMLPALALGLICVGVLWTPPQAELQRSIVLPEHIEEALLINIQDKDACELLAHIFTRCAQQGTQEIYHSLLPLVMLEGVEEFFVRLDQRVVPALLFTQLQNAIDNVVYEAQVKRIARVLGRFGAAIVGHATRLSLPAPQRSPRLRAAVINVLGGTNDASAVDPLIARLKDTEAFIVERATNALIRLGPALALTRVVQELEPQPADPLSRREHQAALYILERFLNEQDTQRQLSPLQYQLVLERIVPVLNSNYQAEIEVQRRAQEILVRQGRKLSEIGSPDTPDSRWTHLMEALVGYLASQDETAIRNVMQVLEEIGTPTVPHLMTLLQRPEDDVRVHTIKVLTTIRDPRALPALLPLLASKSHGIQQQVAQALSIYAPESIAALIDFVLHDASDTVADRASQILVDIGQPVVEPVIAALPEIMPGRTRFLVQVLEVIHDDRAIDALIALVQTPQLEPLLTIALVRALGQFADRRVVAPLLEILATTNPQFYEEAITALSQLGDVALGELIAALDVEQDSVVVQRVRRAVLGMSPFPGEQLMQALGGASRAQTRQILEVFRLQGRDGAAVLVRHLLHPDERLRNEIQHTLESMPGSVVVPGLLAVLTQPALRKMASDLLLKYPDAAIPPLVEMLGDPERGAIAAVLLPQFGISILKSLILALDDQRNMAREFAQRVLVALVHRDQGQAERSTLREIVNLLADALPARAREAIVEVLTNELAQLSLPILLDGLENVHLIEAVAEALMLMANKPLMQEQVLDALIAALSIDEQRSGSELALIRIGTPAVARVGDLIIDADPVIARSAMHILTEIGIPALSFIWTAYSDRNNPRRREAARIVFQNMPPEVIKDELVTLLVGSNRDDIAMAVSLLLERVHEEEQMEYQDQVMVPELIEYIETHNVQETNLRIIALLLLTGEQAITDHLIQALEDNPQHRKQLTYMLLLLGPRTRSLLFDICADPNTDTELRNELVGVLSMFTPPAALVDAVYKISEYGLSGADAGALFSEQLPFALRVLGGLLVSGQWSPRKLMDLRDALNSEEPGYELFNVLLGWRYTPQIEKLQSDMDEQRNIFKKELLALTAAVAERQQLLSNAETELERTRQEHGVRSDELQKVSRERDAMRAHIEQLTNEKNKQRIALEETTRRYNSLLSQYQGLQRQLQGLSQGPDPDQDIRRVNRPQNTIR